MRPRLTARHLCPLAVALLLGWLAASAHAQTDAPPPSPSLAADPAGPPAAASGDQVPVLAFDNLEHHAGEAKPGSTVSHDFVVRNTGTAPLLISDVVPGCGCSVATFPAQVAPGGEGIITLAVDLYTEWAGHDVNKSAVVLTNDPQSPAVRLIMRATVLPL